MANTIPVYKTLMFQESYTVNKKAGKTGLVK